MYQWVNDRQLDIFCVTTNNSLQVINGISTVLNVANHLNSTCNDHKPIHLWCPNNIECCWSKSVSPCHFWSFYPQYILNTFCFHVDITYGDMTNKKIKQCNRMFCCSKKSGELLLTWSSHIFKFSSDCFPSLKNVV